jgi:hypothetical protein
MLNTHTALPAPGVDQADHQVPWRKTAVGAVLTHNVDNSGKFHARYPRPIGRFHGSGLSSATEQRVGEVHRGEVNPDTDIIRRRWGGGKGSDREDFGTTERIQNDGLHGARSSNLIERDTRDAEHW